MRTMVASLFPEFDIFIRVKHKSKKHKEITTDYDTIKSKHLEVLADKMLKRDDKNQKLKTKQVDPNFLNLF